MAVYLLNRSPTVAVEGDHTPFELWNQKKPDVSNLRVFGAECFVHIPKQKRKKLNFKTEKATFVGYAPNGYRIWNGKKVFIARDVVFNEGKSGEIQSVDGRNREDEQLVVIQEQLDVYPEPVRTEEDVMLNNDDEPVTEDELDDTLIDEAAGGDPDPADVRRSCRNRERPTWHEDYNISAFA